jgi:5-methylthioadenosine/S-adenosylhomocysteine deaminase
MHTKIINAHIITLNNEDEIHKNGSVVFENDLIVEVNSNNESKLVCDYVIDAKNKVLLPGFVNTHTHTPMTLLRGYAEDYSLEEWLQRIWPIEKKLTRADIVLGSELAMIEMLLNGITTFSDLYIHIDAIAEKVSESGMRAVLARSVIEDPNNQENSRAKLNEAVRNVRELRNSANGRIQMALSPHSIYTCSGDYLIKILEEAKLLGAQIQIHLAESLREYDYAQANFGLSPVKYLDSLGYFEHDVLVVHGVQVDEEDIEILASKNINLSHNPTSNLKLGNGIAPISQYLNKGINVGLGTDGAASNNRLDILAEIRMTTLLHKGITKDPTTINAVKGLKMGTINGAKALMHEDKIGSIESGKKADFILLDMDKPNLLPNNDIIANIVYSATAANITNVFIDGKEIMRNKEILTIDVERTTEMITKILNKMYN